MKTIRFCADFKFASWFELDYEFVVLNVSISLSRKGQLNAVL